MGEWQAPVLAGLGAGVLVAVCALVFRRAAPQWAGGGRLAVLIVVAVVLGASIPLLLRPVEEPPAGPSDDAVTRLVARLKSGDLGERLAAIRELDELGQYQPRKIPEITEAVSTFVRDRAPKADDPGCASSEPAKDIVAALRLLRARATAYDAHDVVVDLHGTCLAHAEMRATSLVGGKLADANLTGATLKSADLTGADLARANLAGTSLSGAQLVDTRLVDARFAETDLTGAHFSDDTFWPPQHEEAVMAASSFATTTFVIGDLVLTDPR